MSSNIDVSRTLSGTMLLVSLLYPAGSARAQEAPPEVPPAASPSPATDPGGPPADARPPEPPPVPPTVRDGVRLRGGFSLNGGVFLLPNNPAGGAASLAGRLGVQFNHYFAIYYQNTPILGATMAHDQRSATVVAADYNSLLLNLTLFHTLELGAGPSLDYVALAKGSITVAGLSSSASASSGTGVAAGGHGRVAFNIGGLSGNGLDRPNRACWACFIQMNKWFAFMS